MALCVSLWIAGGGVAGANGFLYLDAGNQPHYENGSKPEDATVTSDPAKKTLNIVGGTWPETPHDPALGTCNNWDIAGGVGSWNPYHTWSNQDAIGYTLNLRDIVSLPAQGGSNSRCYGGYTSGGGTVSQNRIYVESGNLQILYGGYSASGKATYNTLIINDGTTRDVYGGYVQSGTGDAANNTVEIHGGTINSANIRGGYAHIGNATDNTVIIDGGEIAHDDADILGGSVWNTSGDGNARGNKVIVSGGNIKGMIMGGLTGQNTDNPPTHITHIEYNTVTLGGDLTGKTPTLIIHGDTLVYGGRYSTADPPPPSRANHNAVNLTGATGVANGKTLKLYGRANANPNAEGNELHLGGVKTYKNDGNGNYTASVAAGAAFAGYTQDAEGTWSQTNAVSEVRNFDAIVLHKVDWSETVPALKADSFTYNWVTDLTDKTTLDVTDMTFDKTPAGTMTLLESATDDNFENLKLTYAKGNGTLTSAAPISYTVNSEKSTENGVTIVRDTTYKFSLEDTAKKVNYSVTGPVRSISFGEMTWGTPRDASAAGWDYASVTVTDIDASGLKFKNPETIAAGSTTLLEANNTLADFSAQTKNLSYENYSPVPGVTLNGQILGSYAAKDGKITYTATANQANKLTFGAVAWKDTGALMARPENITFAGADVDTSNISFTGVSELNANQKMTLVSDFGGAVGTITGDKYKIGTTLEGKGKASLSGKDLIFTAETNSEGGGGEGGGGGKGDSGLVTQAQTHNTVMGAEVGMAALSMGNDFIGEAMLGLGLDMNTGDDGFSTFAKLGGGAMRQETGSHIDSHTWNAILGLGHQNKKERGTTEYGAFFEYGTGNYTTQSDEGRGDGSSRYTGGGILGKYTLANGVYVEGSFRAGTVHDDARDVLHDAKGVGYSYDTNANYLGAHIGFGKEIQVAGGNVVDVYGKYFYNRRNSVSFDVAAGDHYDLDAVTSQIIRVGARYTMKRDKWNFYGGLAYEHELDGKANGTAGNGGVSAPIRGADISGASFRGELGATMKPGENSPWSLDLNVSGFAGKKQGFTGGVSVAFMF